MNFTPFGATFTADALPAGHQFTTAKFAQQMGTTASGQVVGFLNSDEQGLKYLRPVDANGAFTLSLQQASSNNTQDNQIIAVPIIDQGKPGKIAQQQMQVVNPANNMTTGGEKYSVPLTLQHFQQGGENIMVGVIDPNSLSLPTTGGILVNKMTSVSSLKADHPPNILVEARNNNVQVPKDSGEEETTGFNENNSKVTLRPPKRKRMDEFLKLPDTKKVDQGIRLGLSITSLDKENETSKCKVNGCQSHVAMYDENVLPKHETVKQINFCHDNTKENLKSPNHNEKVDTENEQLRSMKGSTGKTLVLRLKKLCPMKGVSEKKVNQFGKTMNMEEQNIANNKKPYKCDKCNLCFSRRARLNSHQTEHKADSSPETDSSSETDEEEKPLSCDICEKSFKYPSGLSAHELTHTDIAPFKCEYCEVSFRQKSHLKRHKSIHLKNSKKFKCPECKLGFRRKSYLDTHQRIHKNERRFVCSDCKKAFTQKSHLNEHKKIHFDSKEFICNECNRGFHQIYKLRDHMMKVHGFKA